jgi:tetratricopeptide (TPR) repeat protein
MCCPRPAAAVAAALFILAATAAVAAVSSPQGPDPGAPGGGRLLDVPYLPQTEDLCGGAAVAMVLRYWGEQQVYPEDFEPLVDRSAAGIRTDVLTADVRRRGWQALPFGVDAALSGDWMPGHVNNGRPVIALIEVRPDRYHYVVIVAWTGERVIAHDPARAPFRVLSRAEFDRAWAAAGRWALLVLPSEARATGGEAPAALPEAGMPSPAGPCALLVQEMVARARDGDVAGAETGLSEATRLCPQLAAAWRELAGVRFLQSRWAEASALAERASRLDPDDGPGWDLLGTSRFLNDEPEAALEAWNRIGRPTVDLVRIEGATRTRHPVIAGVIDLPARTLLTPARYGRASRRLQDLPSAGIARLSYRPMNDGLAEVQAAMVERPTVPRGVVPIAAASGRALVQRELRLNAAAPTGSGELWTLAWRWWEARPRVAFALAVPGPSRFAGVATVEGVWERQSYAMPAGPGAEGPAAIRADERRRTAVRLSDWATHRVRWDAGLALDRWADDDHASLDLGVDTRLAGDRVSIGLDAAAWTPLGSGARFTRAGASAAWRSTAEPARHTWHASAGVAAASAEAPFDLWPGAGAGHARTPLLRAHPLLDAGVVHGEVFGRTLAHATAEYHQRLVATPAGAVAVAVFADSARAWRVNGSTSGTTEVVPSIGPTVRSPWHTDVGAGLRLALPGSGGTARIDVARGLQDGRLVLSAGWQTPWPGR